MISDPLLLRVTITDPHWLFDHNCRGVCVVLSEVMCQYFFFFFWLMITLTVYKNASQEKGNPKMKQNSYLSF